MASEINPSLTPTKSLDNFRFWCQKVLPLVYDDSLSYYEVLGKMVVQLNDIIDDVNADTENVLTLKDAFLDLQTYVNEFFDDIDQLASYAERAEDAQTAANTSAINAASSASNASASSIAAMNAKDAAVTAKEAAEASASTASTAATNANTKASEAAQSAITAQTAQASASQSATLAATDRSAAQTAANTATTKASEASTSATNAETSAENAAQSEADAEELVNNIQENLDNIQQNTEDIIDLKESTNIFDSRINNENYLVDYDYNEDQDLPGTVAASVGISRRKTLITLNNTEATPGEKIKLNGNIARVAYSGTNSSNAIKAWEGIALKTYHLYKVYARIISGEASVSEGEVLFGISIYPEGSASTIGSQSWDGEARAFTRLFTYTDTPVNVAFLGVPTAIYNNCLIDVTIEDVTAKAVKAYDSLNASLKSKKNTINYGYFEEYGNSSEANSTSATVIGVEQIGNVIRLNGINTIDRNITVKISNGPVRTTKNSAIQLWTGIDLIVGHTYEIISTLVGGSATFPDRVYTGIPVSIYRNGFSSTEGIPKVLDSGQYMRVFTAVDVNHTLALVIPAGFAFEDAVFTVVMKDITTAEESQFLSTANTSRLFTRSNDERDIAQSFVCVEGCLYVYHYFYDGTNFYGHGIRKIDFINGTDVQYNMNLGHGNGMTYYNGKLYVCDMETTGKIHVVNLSTMEEETPIIFTIDGAATYNSGIAYDYENNQFIIKTNSGFAFADTDFVYDHSVTRSQSVPGTGQSISCDGNYIYEIKSDPNYIYVFDHSGTYQGQIAINNSDEAEGMFNDGVGGWFILTNVPELGWYVDAAQIFTQLSFDNIVALAKIYGAVGYKY